jgi:hypothetical protein
MHPGKCLKTGQILQNELLINEGAMSKTGSACGSFFGNSQLRRRQ